ncbi:hypothetical protein [Spiroplasma monobiae]|uniref:Uncharacterized protein n=1 Tax=Spiroplasma monobiae MQ-1 TaxID=1336748 RepID=A0A2K9LTG2_SPISQ|nr:hypothetical protein [Spiroplasma monobiae]AUM62353.1 hypothetical protein SMONO_v1c01000 [Spiroplasma monobiae MQ-1]
MKKDLNVVKREESTSNFQKEVKNFFLLYRINLKLSLRDVGSIISGILFASLVTLFFILEFSEIIVAGSADKYGTYKILVYTLGSSTLIFHILLSSLYLFKKQVKDGIASIELRAGFKTWKSYLIRVLIVFSTSLVYIGVSLAITIVLNAMSIGNTKLFFNLHYSQVFFLTFLAFFSTMIMTVVMVMFKTSMATMFAMVYMIAIALAPITASFSYLLFQERDTNYNTNIRIISGSKFYNSFKGNEELFNDDNGFGKSKTTTSINEYVKATLDPLSEYTEDGKSIYDENYKMEGFSLRHSVEMNGASSSVKFENSKASHILTKNLGFGQVYYNYNVFEENGVESKQEYLLEETPIWPLLEAINEAVLKNQDSFSSNNSGEIPTLFIEKSSYYWMNRIDGKNMDIDNLVKELSRQLPEYSGILKFIQNFYNQYRSILADAYYKGRYWSSGSSYKASYNDILDNALIPSSRGVQIDNYYSWKELYTIGNYPNYSDPFNFDEVDAPNKRDRCSLGYKNELAKSHNDEMAKVYKSFPELTILNQLIVSLWRMAMDFDIYRTDELDSSLYEYYNTTVASNTLKTDIFRHFAAMSTGLFSDVLYNDLFNVSNEVFYQGQFYTVTNIFDFENFSYTNREADAAMQPAYKTTKIKTKTLFLIPLAYFVYIVLISPLGYIGYVVFNKKAKL